MATSLNRFSEADKLFSEAMALLNRGEISGAANLFSEITERFPDHGKAWFELGNIHRIQLEDFESAGECYLKCMNALPAYAPAYLAYADVLFVLEKYAESNAIINQAMEIKGVRKDIALFKSALLMESQERFDEAITTYRKALLKSFSEDEILKCEKGINRCNLKKKHLL